MAILDEVLAEWARHKGIVKPPSEMITLWQSPPGRHIYIHNKLGPPIPYPPADHGDGEINHGYLPLKGNPEAIAQIPEVQGWPELSDFLEVVNATSSPIETIGCEKGFFPVTKHETITAELGCYIDLMFTDFEINERPEQLLALASEIMEALSGCEKWWASISVGMQRIQYNGGITPWGLMLNVTNYGRSESEAREFWVYSFKRIQNAIAKLPTNYGKAS